MDVRELTFKGESDPKLYACGKCGKAYSPKIYACRDDMAHAAARRAAEECCKPRFCDCGAELGQGWTACSPCRERKMLTKATVIERDGYDGPVSADCSGEWGDGYSSEIEAMIEHCRDAGEPIPAYCHPCIEERLQLDPADILEHATHQNSQKLVKNAIQDWLQELPHSRWICYAQLRDGTLTGET